MFVRALVLVVAALTPLWGQQRLLTTSEILKREGPAVVMVETSDNGGKLTGQGSGVVLLSEGVIATNFHVIEDACNVIVKFSTSGQTVPVTALVGADQDNDLALLRVNAQGLPTAEVGKSAQLKPGDGVVAIGNPMGLEQSVSEGIVSGIRRTGSRYWIQTTAPISPGSSGGGLYSRRGELVGITSLTLKESQNLNFAVPVERALGLLNTPYTPSQEVPWSRIRELRCKQSSDNLDWSVIAGVLGRPLSDSAVQDFLRKLNGGSMPTPNIGGSPESGEYRIFEFPSLGVILNFRNGRGYAVNLYGKEMVWHDGRVTVAPFKGILPFGIGWGLTRANAHKQLGPGTSTLDVRTFWTRSGEPYRPANGGVLQDTYEGGGRCYTFCYTESGTLVSIAIGL